MKESIQAKTKILLNQLKSNLWTLTLTIVKSDPENDHGDPIEQVTRYNKDPSWSAEIDEFVECIINDKDITNGSSTDAINTMKLVYRIYYSDIEWRNAFNIQNPEEF